MNLNSLRLCSKRAGRSAHRQAEGMPLAELRLARVGLYSRLALHSSPEWCLWWLQVVELGGKAWDCGRAEKIASMLTLARWLFTFLTTLWNFFQLQ